MGEVYEAEDQELRSRVALKTVLATFAADDTALERLNARSAPRSTGEPSQRLSDPRALRHPHR